MTRWHPKRWNIDIDRYINPWLPPPPWQHLPTPISRFLGYRREVPEKVGNIVLIFWAFIGVFCSIAIIEVASYNIPSFRHNGVPIIVGSFGAAAVLEFYSIDAPLAQPRNAILGQVISCVIGIGVCKLFLLSPDFDSLRWVAGAVACAAATSAMAFTKTVHPPAGATALLAVVDDAIIDLGWFLIPVVLLGCALMLVAALVINNIQRRFPIYWWTPEDLAAQGTRHWPWWRRRRHRRGGEERGPEGAKSEGSVQSRDDDDEEAQRSEDTAREEDEFEQEVRSEKEGRPSEDGRHRPTAARVGRWRTNSESTGAFMHDRELVIRPGVVIAPDDLQITPEEKLFLESLSQRL